MMNSQKTIGMINSRLKNPECGFGDSVYLVPHLCSCVPVLMVIWNIIESSRTPATAFPH